MPVAALAVPLGVWPSSQSAECAIGRRWWRLCGTLLYSVLYLVRLPSACKGGGHDCRTCDCKIKGNAGNPKSVRDSP